MGTTVLLRSAVHPETDSVDAPVARPLRRPPHVRRFFGRGPERPDHS